MHCECFFRREEFLTAHTMWIVTYKRGLMVGVFQRWHDWMRRYCCCCEFVVRVAVNQQATKWCGAVCARACVCVIFSRKWCVDKVLLSHKICDKDWNTENQLVYVIHVQNTKDMYKHTHMSRQLTSAIRALIENTDKNVNPNPVTSLSHKKHVRWMFQNTEIQY